MRSIEYRFRSIQRKNPGLSTFICFSKAIQGKRFNQEVIRKGFNKLVDKNDYAEDEKMTHLKYLYAITRDPL